MRAVARKGSAISLAAISVVLFGATSPTFGQGKPDYRDDRSSPRALVESLYNALERHEYARAWSYFDESAVAPFPEFEAGYADTASLRLRVDAETDEGAAGSLYGSVGVTLEAVSPDGVVSVFTGCYETRLVQPAAQIEPPYRPIRIVAAELERTDDPFADAAGACPPEGL